MSHIEVAQRAVLSRYGPGHQDVAACAAVFARGATVAEYEEWLSAVADSAQHALSNLQTHTPAGVLEAEAILTLLVKKLRGEQS